MKRPVDLELFYKKKSGVVTDGLVSWIDGQDELTVVSENNGICNVATIVDRVDGEECTAKQISGTMNKGIFSKEDSFFKQEASYYHGVTITISKETAKTAKTIEAIISSENASNGLNSKLKIGENIVFYGRNANTSVNYFGSSFSIPYPFAPLHIVGTIENGISTIYVNGVKGTAGTNASEFNVTSLFSIDYDTYYTYKAVQKIGAIRLYDRGLTESEIMQNYNYEKSLGRVD